MDTKNIEESLIDKMASDKLSLSDFASRLQLDETNISTIKLFNLFKNSDNQVDFREYLLCALFLIKLDKPKIQLIELLFKVI